MTIPGICQACGNEFWYRETHKAERKKFCKTCMQIRTNTYNRCIRAEDPEVKEVRKRMSYIADIADKAKNSGMSYGEYMASKNRKVI